MRFLFALVITFSLTLYGAEPPPTFVSNPDAPHYSTGAVKPLTAEQKKLDAEFVAQSEKEGWTFDWNVEHVGEYSTGYVKPDLSKTTGESVTLSLADEVIAKVTSLLDFGIDLPPTKNQGRCGSCVYFAITWGFEATNWLMGNQTPVLAPKHVMNCSNSGWKCGGAFGSGVAEGVQKMGGVVAESVYPYKTPYEQSCNTVPSTAVKYGAIESFRMIDPNPEQIAIGVKTRHAVMVTVSANPQFMGYESGVYNACSQGQTNHEVVIIEVDCESSVDAAGNCVFKDGKLPPGVGTYLVQNSWGGAYGEGGRIRMKITDKSGRKCNRIAEEALIIETGLPMPVVGPVQFNMGGSSKLNVTVNPGELKADPVKAALTMTGFKEQK